MIVNKKNAHKVMHHYNLIRFRTPYSHWESKHKVTCGCLLDVESELQKGESIFICRICGSAYKLTEVLSFPHWRCYDCNSVYDMTETHFITTKENP